MLEHVDRKCLRRKSNKSDMSALRQEKVASIIYSRYNLHRLSTWQSFLLWQTTKTCMFFTSSRQLFMLIYQKRIGGVGNQSEEIDLTVVPPSYYYYYYYHYFLFPSLSLSSVFLFSSVVHRTIDIYHSDVKLNKLSSRWMCTFFSRLSFFLFVIWLVFMPKTFHLIKIYW